MAIQQRTRYTGDVSYVGRLIATQTWPSPIVPAGQMQTGVEPTSRQSALGSHLAREQGLGSNVSDWQFGPSKPGLQTHLCPKQRAFSEQLSHSWLVAEPEQRKPPFSFWHFSFPHRSANSWHSSISTHWLLDSINPGWQLQVKEPKIMKLHVERFALTFCVFAESIF